MAAAAGVPARTAARSRHPAADRQGDTADGEETPMTHGAVVVDDDPLARVSALVRAIPDFPEPGVVFRDITPVLADGAGLHGRRARARGARPARRDVVVGVEARGFLLGAAAALTAGTGIVPVRKAGKLPRVAASRSYDLEYGTATLELPADAVQRRARGCSSSTTCWPPVARPRRPATWSTRPAPRSSGSR